MEFRDVHELVINKLRSVVIRYRLPVSPQNLPTDRQPAHYQQAVLVIIQVCYWMLSGS